MYVRDRRHAKFAIENEYANRLLGWHEQVVTVLSRASHLGLNRKSSEHLAELGLLYALIEQGRFLFPNIDLGDNYGEEKPPAYCGYRNLALDFLVATYNLLHHPPSEESIRQLRTLQRHFTSIVFELVRPKDRLQTIRALTDRYFVKEQSFEDFLQHADGAVLDNIWRSPR